MLGTIWWIVSWFLYLPTEGGSITTLQLVFRSATSTSEGAGTRVTMSVEGKPTGVLRFVPGSVLEAAFREQVKESLTLLKQCLEGRA